MESQERMQIYPGRGLGFIALGASLQIILSRLRVQADRFPTIEIYYSPASPLSRPVVLNLPSNGVRLRFDGPSQKLRLIEILDFSATPFTYNGKDVVKLPVAQTGSTGPTFRHVYDKLTGPTFPGEYLPPASFPSASSGTYILSYPGIAFNFPIKHEAWNESQDFVTSLSSSATGPATSIAIFHGSSWPEARLHLFTRPALNLRSLDSHRDKEQKPAEVEHVEILGNGYVDLHRQGASVFHVLLGATTPQDLVAELGPPDAIFRKSDRRLSIHDSSATKQQHAAKALRSTRNDHLSNITAGYDSDLLDELTGAEHDSSRKSSEAFYNYFDHGFDILVSLPRPPAKNSVATTLERNLAESHCYGAPDQLVVTKILLHGNLPGSYTFNRHRRCRWTINLDGSAATSSPALTSETLFSDIQSSLDQKWKYDDMKPRRRQGMVLNRGWGNSPGSSCELLGNWEEESADTGTDGHVRKRHIDDGDDGPGLGNTELFGYPGLVFEVLKNDLVNCLTVY